MNNTNTKKNNNLLRQQRFQQKRKEQMAHLAAENATLRTQVAELSKQAALLVEECAGLRAVLDVNRFLADNAIVAGETSPSPSTSSTANESNTNTNTNTYTIRNQPSINDTAINTEYNNNRNQSSTSIKPNPSNKPQQLLSLSAHDIFGPIISRPARDACKKLSSLKHCRYVDMLFDAFEAQSKSRDWDEIRRLNFKTMYLRGKLLDACGILDRHCVVEIMVQFLQLNKSHIEHRDSAFSDADSQFSALRPWKTPRGVAMPAGAIQLRESLHSISILQTPENFALADEFISVYWTPVSHRRSKEKLHRLMALGKRIEKLCASSPQDSYKINMLIEVAREGNRNLWNSLFDGMGFEEE